MQQHFKITASRILALVLVGGHAAAIGISMLLLPAVLAWPLSLILLLSLIYYLLRDAWLRSPGSFVGLTLEGEGVILHKRDGSRLSCQLAADSLVMPVLTVLNVIPEGGRARYALVIFPDSLLREDYRRLRVRLKWGGYGRPQVLPPV